MKKIIIISIIAIITGCSSAPKVKEPTGEKVPVNQITQSTTQGI